eukprot:TRINITY_DN689_c0_g1_i1.p1 TRINITY_DN689_c0_g1~~TRINITY_DN689_c0_g1_i1.p1  ORF type:complete len:197 (-),score=41.33 TRINITY_DN689_c0_g1_i1:55-645(-)
MAAHSAREAKVVLLGDTGVGKSSILLRYVRDEYTDDGEPTIGAGFMSKTIPLNSDTIKFQIWDTAGQEKYHSLAPMYYKEAHVALLVYDVTNKSSFEVMKLWVSELTTFGPKDIVIAIAGNKIDLMGQVEVDYMEASQYAKSLNALFALTSAKEDKGITELFTKVGQEIFTRDIEFQEKNAQALKNSKSETKKGCC